MSEQNTSWLTACMRLMMTLRLRTKFALISVAFLTPLAITVYALLSYARDGIAFAEKEIVGTVYLSAVQPVLRDAATDGAVTAATSALKRQMDQDQDVLALDVPLSQLRAANAHELGNAVLSLYSDIGDRSNLILDPDIDSYYTMSMAVVLTPRMALVQGQIAALMSGGDLTDPKVRAQLTALSARLQEYQFEVKQAWARATKGNPELANRINLDWQVANAAVINAIDMGGAHGAQLAQQAIQETLKINSISNHVLVELLQKRIDGLVHKRNMYIALAFASLLIVGYLISGFYWCEVQGFGALTKRMSRLAEGNLVADFRAQGDDEIGDLINAYEHSRHELYGLIEKIHQVADTINTAGGEIAAANLNLSMRTSEQSQLISDAATQVEQVTDKVQANLESAANANLISREAFAEAESGKQVMDHVITTIHAMKGSSTKIGAIIDVINEIAFQTNLLALNAAVEAARAGEQGRGFAVVAGEVRHLAQRCSTAANEITQLIKASVAEVDQGVAQVARAGKSMQEILESTRTVSDIMGEMVIAGKTQAAAIQNIQSVVGKIDSDAQQNAAMVEQTSAAAELLHQQAQELMRSISRFLAHQETQQGMSAEHNAASAPNQALPPSSMSHAA